MVFLPTTTWFTQFNFLNVWLSIFNSMQWPYFIAFGFPDQPYLKDPNLIFILIGEVFDMMNISFRFFMAYKNEGNRYETNLQKIQSKYIKGDFIIDLIIFIPWGLLSVTSPKLKWTRILFTLKTVRIKKLFAFLDKSVISPILRQFKENKVDRILQDPAKRDDVNKDHINLHRFLYFSYAVNIFKTIIQLFIFAYFLGIFWYFYINIITGHFYDSHESGVPDDIEQSIDDESFIDN